ncbi:MAG: hypothetical protein ACXV4Z_02820 [Halobacteriota archaeon]
MHLSEMEEWELQRHDRHKWREFLREGPRPERLHVTPTADDIQELRQSYSDTKNSADERKGRSLCYFSDALFNGAELMAALIDAMPEGYSEFDPAVTVPLLVREYEDVALFQPARETSVSIYVHSNNEDPLPMPTPETEKHLKADELDYVNASNTIIRFWWG